MSPESLTFSALRWRLSSQWFHIEWMISPPFSALVMVDEEVPAKAQSMRRVWMTSIRVSVRRYVVIYRPDGVARHDLLTLIIVRAFFPRIPLEYSDINKSIFRRCDDDSACRLAGIIW